MVDLNVKEVAVLAGVTERSVQKAIDEKLIGTRRAGRRGVQVRLPVHSIPYAAVVGRIDFPLTRDSKRRLVRTFKARKLSDMTSAPVEIAPSVTVDVSTLIGDDLVTRAETYLQHRNDLIECNPDVMGGAPVLRGTRITVHSLLSRLEKNETVDTILEDYPDLSREALETALTFARTHPRRGRPVTKPRKQQG